jgi:hypothetical protein
MVVGLLIAQSTLNEGVGKAVYLVPDTYLAARVREEAARLGLPTAERHDAPNFLAAQTTHVTTFQKLINSQSVFGVVGSQHTSLDLGVNDGSRDRRCREYVHRGAAPGVAAELRRTAKG